MRAKLQSVYFGLVLVAGLAQVQTARGMVTFSVTPNTVSNTYNGTVTLEIDGLTNGETVDIQKYLDININGVIDSNDLMVRDFRLTAGQSGAVVIGGVTNVNVPFNSNTNANAVTTTLNFQDGDISQSFVGQYLFKLSSPSGQMTNLLTVMNGLYAQKITGTVMTVPDEAPVPDAIVILFQPSGGGSLQGVTGAVADNSGHYTIAAQAGTYSLVAVKTNFVADRAPAGDLDLVLASGQTVSTNLGLIPTTESISGKFIDSATGNGLPGLLVPLKSTSGLFALGFTDANGNFNLGVTSGQWGIGGNVGAIALRGYVGLNNAVLVDATIGSESNVTIAVPKATALFYGYVTNGSGNPVSGVFVEADDGLYDTYGYTAADGSYVAGAVGDLGTNHQATLGVENPLLYPDYSFSQSMLNQDGGTNIAIDAAVMVNFSAAYSGLVLNGGFQTGDFTDWTLSGDTNNTFVDEGYLSGITPYFGKYEAALGTSGSLGYLSQTLSTTAGAAYLLSFSYDNPYADSAEFLVSWNGNTLLDAANLQADDWTNIQFLISATGTSTVLQFGFEDDDDNLGLDDISVVLA